MIYVFLTEHSREGINLNIFTYNLGCVYINKDFHSIPQEELTFTAV